MLERDRRRAAHRKYAAKLARRERLENDAKWAACRNSGFTVPKLNEWTSRFEFTTPEEYVESIAVFDTDKGKRLVCHECMTEWSTNTNFTHP